jgi:adenine-specific DNA-methyltransferase
MRLIQNAPREKLNGSFYTPEPIADFILKWAMNGNTNYDILEPGCGDGAFLRRLAAGKFRFNSVVGVELDKREANKAASIQLPHATIINAEFHGYCNSANQRYNLCIGNPPFIRYQYFDKTQQIEAEKIFSRAGLEYSKLTNPWVSFVVGSSLLLKEHGKLGFVVPAEILQVSYAARLRNFLAHFYNKIVIISFKKLVFPSAQQEVVLLLCERNDLDKHTIEHIELENAQALSSVDIPKLKTPTKNIDFQSNKWTFYFLEQPQIDFIERLLKEKKIPTIGQHARVEVGMTTGFNKFFTVPASIVKQYKLQEFTERMVGRSVQIPSLIFTEEDWKANVKSGARAYFLLFKPKSYLKQEGHEGALAYIKLAELKKINEGYKCSIRDEWHIVPSAWASEALFQRRNNIHPKLVVNEAKAYTTDTMHRVTVKTHDVNGFVASYYNSLSLASAEICGRSHGGGALELMPNEVENVLLPYRKENGQILAHLDKMMRAGEKIDEILSYSDPIILKEGYGFSNDEIDLANRIWKRLMTRRLKRGKS